MAEFVSKPQTVDAIQWTGGNFDLLRLAFGDKVHLKLASGIDSGLLLKAGKDGAQEWVPVPVGHWLVHPPGDLTDIWPVENDYFQEKYGAGVDRRADYAIGSDVWPGASKFVEEAGEALTVFGKLMGTGGNTDYWGGVDLRDKFVEELSDVLAAIGFFAAENLTAQEILGIDARTDMKLALYREWHAQGHPKDQVWEEVPSPT